MMITIVGRWVFLLVPAHPGSPGHRAVKQLLLLLYWCHLANTTEPSMCGGDAALCQIMLTTCFT